MVTGKWKVPDQLRTSSGPASDELVFQKQGNSFRRHLYSIGYTHIFKFLHNKKNFVINSFWVDRPLQWNLPFTSNLCNPFKHHLRCASLYGVDFVFKRERREKRAQRRSCLKGLQRLFPDRSFPQFYDLMSFRRFSNPQSKGCNFDTSEKVKRCNFEKFCTFHIYKIYDWRPNFVVRTGMILVRVIDEN